MPFLQLLTNRGSSQPQINLISSLCHFRLVYHTQAHPNFQAGMAVPKSLELGSD